jgi:hypothetical protein
MPATNAKRILEQDLFLRPGEPTTAKARASNRPRKRVRETTAHSEQPLVEPSVSSGIVQPVLPNSGDEQFSSDDVPMFAKLKTNQKKRVMEIAALKQRPLAKSKATRRQQKNAKAINEEAQQRLTQDLFATCAGEPAETEAFADPVQPSSLARLRRWMDRLHAELKLLKNRSWFADNADIEKMQLMINQAKDLQTIPATFQILRQDYIRILYKPRCGALQKNSGPYENSFSCNCECHRRIGRHSRAACGSEQRDG